MISDVKYPMTWDLDSLLPHPDQPAFREQMELYANDLARLADRTDRLPAASDDQKTISEWALVLADYASVEARGRDLSSFVGCHAAADAGNSLFRMLEGELSALQPLSQRIATNIENALKQANDDEFERFLKADERLTSVSYFLTVGRRHARFRLPTVEENLAAELNVEGLQGWSRLYDQLSGDLRVQVMVRGELVEKSPGQVPLDAPERTVRENNFYATSKAWNTIASPCASALNRISGSRLTIYRRLGLRDHLEVPLHDNRITRETLMSLWETVETRKPILVNYLRRKADLLGVERLRWYDLHAPLPVPLGASKPGGRKAAPSYQVACEEIINAFSGFTTDLGDLARLALGKGWVEAENRSGKRQGGFCTGFPTSQQSRIFMTFNDTPDSVSTLAHELGHAYHTHVLRQQPFFHREYPMSLAETASTFAEAVLGEQQRRGAQSPAEELRILDGMLMDAVTFLMNIHARFLFEDTFYTERKKGEVSRTRLDELMLQAQKRAYLDILEEDGWYPGFWISKQHFYFSDLSFYNFPYTFGYLLSLGLFALAEEEGHGFADRFRTFLSETGSKDSEDVVRNAFGQDLTDGSFWNKSLDVVERRVERFLELAGT